MKKGISEITKKTVLVSLSDRNRTQELIEEHLNELEFLAQTDGMQTISKIIQRLESPNPRTYIGKGKLKDLTVFVKANKIDTVIFDDDLSPSQLRNIENSLKIRIYDRSLLILEIFSKHAKTDQAKNQVELARYQYLLPRLTRMWTHLERQRGGTSTRGGAGEKEIETDRRILRNRISILKSKLDKIEKRNIVQRKQRGRIVRVALVGYTNVGKSTIINLLSKSDVKTKNELFATLDTTVRKINFDDIPFLLSDTVGFIRKLPAHLIESFKSTFSEIKESDILLHVVDVSHPSYLDHISVVNQTLNEMEALDKPTIYVFNKIDQLETQNFTMEELVDRFRLPFEIDTQIVFISATNKVNIEMLRKNVLNEVKKKHYTIFPNYLKKQIIYKAEN